MANKGSGNHKKGSRENPISLDDNTVAKTSNQRRKNNASKNSKASSTKPKKSRRNSKEFFAPSARPQSGDPFGTWQLHKQLRENAQARKDSGYKSLDEEDYKHLDDYDDLLIEEEIQPKKRGKKQTGPAVRKRVKSSWKPFVSSSKAMDHLMARVVDKSRRGDGD
ncbi:hypothetical protein F4811DRAFT_555908 [Daldinia bambusicola]|nr:hypothetical protein F4811DRAFT_555908 [Daldinia bambusicola]